MNRRILFLFMLAFTTFWSQAQNFQVRGKVTDAKTQQPIPGVSIYEAGKNIGTTTDGNGEYMLSVTTQNGVLNFTSIGYSPKVIALEGRSTVDIQLVESATDLDEVVVTALNLERDSKGLGYAIQQINSREISEVKSANFVDNLAGRVAGVTVNQGATGVGSSSKITIRGESSFTNNNPLFVVDGVPINNNSNINFSNEAAAGFQEVDFGNGAMELNQDDIENVSVLKGPAAAALYGTRAANGVVIITTKKGKENQTGVGISINSSVFVERPFQLPRFQNSYGQGNSGQFEYVDGLGGGTNDNITYSWGPALDQGNQIAQFDSPVTLPDGSLVRGGDVAVHGGAPIQPTEFVSHPDNLKNFYRTGVTTMNNVAVSTAFDKGNYRISFTDLQSTSPIPGVNLDRNTFSGNMNFQPVTKLNIGAGFNYINSRSDNRPSGGYGSENINYSLVAWGPRSMNINALKDYWQPGLEDVQQYSFNYTFFDNPYFILMENRNGFNRDRVFGNLSAKYDFSEHLSLSVLSGMDYSDELRTYRRNYSTNRFKSGAYAEQDVFFREINSSFLWNYKNGNDDFSYDLSFGGNRMDQRIENRQTEALSLAQPGIFNFSNAASALNMFQYVGQKRINSLYGLAKFGYKDILFLDVTARNDWSSALASATSTANTSFFYPSISSSYVFSNQFELPEWMSFGKLRLSWAQVGNDTDPYQTTGAFVGGVSYLNQPTFTAQNTLANANLLPEKTGAIELGTDLRFFEDRVRFDFTYYNATTSNQIISLPIPISSGYSQQVVNGGAVNSKGIELLVGVTPIKKDDFEWNTFLNFSRNVSTVTTLPDGSGTITLAYSRVYDNQNQTVWFQVEEGGRVGDMYGTGYARNENGDFIIGTDGRFIVDNTLKKLGNYNPDFILGINNDFRYKNWNVGFLFDWRKGGQLVSRTLSLAGVAGQIEETENRPDEGVIANGVVNVGTDENPIWEQNTTAVSAETYFRQFYDRNHEENNVYSASYFKLRQFAIGYTFKSEKEKGFVAKGRSLNVSLIGRNLFAISQIPHFDPEQIALQGNQFVNGVEDMSYPSSRSFGLKFGYNF